MSRIQSLVSVIIPVFNCRQFIGEALDSVLQQSLPVYEIIVVDDGSTDGTGEVVKKYLSGITYIRQKNQGIGQARNVGIMNARGNFIAHLDADDIWTRDKLELQMKAFLRDSGLDIVGAYMESFFTPGLQKDLKNTIYCPSEPLPSFSPSAIVVKRQAYHRVGWYETHWEVGQDLNWFIRAREQGLKEGMVPRMLVRRRLHSCNSGIIKRSEGIARVRILKEALDRKRNAAACGGRSHPEGRKKGE